MKKESVRWRFQVLQKILILYLHKRFDVTINTTSIKKHSCVYFVYMCVYAAKLQNSMALNQIAMFVGYEVVNNIWSCVCTQENMFVGSQASPANELVISKAVHALLRTDNLTFLCVCIVQWMEADISTLEKSLLCLLK